MIRLLTRAVGGRPGAWGLAGGSSPLPRACVSCGGQGLGGLRVPRTRFQGDVVRGRGGFAQAAPGLEPRAGLSFSRPADSSSGIHLRNGRGRHWTGWGQLKAPLPGRAVVEAESRVQ